LFGPQAASAKPSPETLALVELVENTRAGAEEALATDLDGPRVLQVRSDGYCAHGRSALGSPNECLPVACEQLLLTVTNRANRHWDRPDNGWAVG
jgi:hypothetical protein